MRVLVIDDKSENLATAYTTLAGHEVVTEHNAERAHTLIREEKWDAVLTDLWMPAPPIRQGNAFGVGLYSANKLKDENNGEMMPIGLVFALMAVSREVKYVAIVTDTGHHSDRLTAALDGIGNGPGRIVNSTDLSNLSYLKTGGKNWGGVLRWISEGVYPPSAE